MCEIVIRTLARNTAYMAEVRELLAHNKKTLGFFPEGALLEYVERGRILIAIRCDECLGFISFRPRGNAVRIVHLCVAPPYRGTGVAHRLVQALSEQTKHYVGLGLFCRSDYGLDAFWSRIGFARRTQKPGRGKERKPLDFYWLDHGHPTLFQGAADSRVRVVLDTNIILDLLDDRNDESQALRSDWLQEDVQYLHAPCLPQDLDDRRASGDLTRQLVELDVLQLSVDERSLTSIVESLRSLLGDREQPSWELDLHQLAETIAGKCHFFVTRDSDLLENAHLVTDRFGLTVLRPADLVIHIDELRDRAKYQTGRLSGTALVAKRVGAGEGHQAGALFVNHGPEKRNSFDRRLFTYLARPDTFETLTVSYPEDEPCGLVVHDRTHPDRLDVPLLRISSRGHPYLMASHLLVNALRKAAGEGRILVRVTDSNLQPATITALDDLNFGFTDGAWFHYSLAFVGGSNEVSDRLLTRGRHVPGHRNLVEELADRILLLVHDSRPNVAIALEKSMWPLKITDAPIPCFIVPIAARWASDLFDEGLSEQKLFGGDEVLLLRHQNVYYRSGRTRVPGGPGRVLWYVSADPRFAGSGALRACSYVDNVAVGLADACFDRYGHLGVFTRDEVRTVGKGRPVMAFTFSHTEALHHPVPYQTVRRLLQMCDGSGAMLQSPATISAKCFRELYQLGQHGHREVSASGEGTVVVH